MYINVDAEICDVVVDNVNNDAKLTILLFEHVENTSDDGDILDIRLTILLFEKVEDREKLAIIGHKSLT